MAVMVLTYRAAPTLPAVLDRIPDTLFGVPTRIVVSDDASGDETPEVARAWAAEQATDRVTVIERPQNLGNGGNQKACLQWGIDKGVDAVAFVHGDEQHPPELLEALLEPVVRGSADVCSGSRLAEPRAARRGGMPRGRLVGNHLLARLQSRIAGVDLTDWHSGFRAYRIATVARLDLGDLPDGFDFDPAIIFSLVDAGAEIVEFPVPTYYGDEISRVQPVRTGLRILRNALAHRGSRRS